MKKCFALILSVVLIGILFIGCGSNICKESGCNEAVVQDGYCETHYSLNFLGDAFDALGDAFGDLLG